MILCGSCRENREVPRGPNTEENSEFELAGHCQTDRKYHIRRSHSSHPPAFAEIGPSRNRKQTISDRSSGSTEVRDIGTQAGCQFTDLPPGFLRNGDAVRHAFTETAFFNFAGQQNLAEAGSQAGIAQ